MTTYYVFTPDQWGQNDQCVGGYKSLMAASIVADPTTGDYIEAWTDLGHVGVVPRLPVPLVITRLVWAIRRARAHARRRVAR